MSKPNINHARRLRKQATGPERKLWNAIRNRQINGFHFRRQHPVGPYVADFACLKARLIIEVDGRQHDLENPAEMRRTLFLESEGFRILRFSNEGALQEFEGVLTAISAALPDPRAP